MNTPPSKPYTDLNSHLKGIFGKRVQKLTVDAGFTCPNRDGHIAQGGCIFCNEKGSGTGAHRLGVTITDQIIQGREALFKRYKSKLFLVYFQAYSNTYAKAEKLKKLYDEALAFDDVVGLSIGTRPDCIDEEKLTLIEGYAKEKLIWVEYGLQSPHDTTLAAINRGHDVACFKEAVKLTRRMAPHVKICAHIILGLPGESREMMLDGAKLLSELGVDGVKLHLLYVVKNTPLDTLYLEGQYTCMEEEAYVETVCDFLELLPPEMVIQRLTGDPHRDELRAPMWPLKKGTTLKRIHETFEKRGTRQGSRYTKKTSNP
ncbi:MAG: TIGR01212 family radical SAM protein [Desulfobacterales bacterium]|nr:TIGR01212 family radical SAM protein [Desulfobacterales bacterium]